MIDKLIEDEKQRDHVLAHIVRHRLPFRVTVVDGRPRSYDQNRLQWQWANEAASQLEDRTAREVQLEWKLMFAVPILMEEDHKFAQLWALMERKLTYQERLQGMEFLDVTRLLSVGGFARFLDAIFQFYTAQGLELTDPDEGRYGPKIGSRVDRRDAGHASPTERQTQDRPASGRAMPGLHQIIQHEADAPVRSPSSTDKRRGE